MPLPPLVEPVAALTDAERARTARNTRLAALGEIGQRRLRGAHVAVVGAGGLGSPVILALAAAGVGTLTVIDDDDVEATNLQRQVLHRLSDVAGPKVDSAVRAAADLSPETVVHAHRERLTAANADRLLSNADLVIDGTDSFETREVVAAACERRGVPLVWGTVQAFDAQVTVFWSRPSAGEPILLADLYPPGSVGEVPSCADVGVLGSLCLQVGSLLATEAVKLIAGIGEPLFGRVLVIDGLRARQREVTLRPTRAADAPAPEPVASVTSAPRPALITARALADAIADAPDSVRILDVREPVETARGMIPGARNVPVGAVVADPTAIVGPVVLVCQAGWRARSAAEALLAAGVDASVLEGGMTAWDAAFSGTAA